MRNPRLAHRYAKALIDMAQEMNQLEVVKKDIDGIRALQNQELNAVFFSPVVKGDKKKKIFDLVFGNRVSTLTTSFFHLVITKGREVVVRDIALAFDEQYQKIKGIEKISITTALPVDEQVTAGIRGKLLDLPRYAGKELIVETKIDSDLIGGFVLQAGDILFDASIRHDLQVIKKQVVENLYVSKILRE